MKKFKWIQVVLLVTFLSMLVTGCFSKETNKIDFGKIEQNVYKNEYFNMEIKIPEGWAVQDSDTQQQIMEQGKNAVAGEDENLKAMLDASELNTVQLLSVFQYPLGTAVPSNPFFGAVAEKISQFPGIKTGKDYLENAKKLMEQANLQYTFDKEIYSETVGGVTFDVMEVSISVGNTVAKQKYYSSIQKDYALNFITSYSTEEELKLLNDILLSVKFNN